MSLGLQVFKNYGGPLLADWSSRVRDIEFETGEHGFIALTAFVPMSISEAFDFYNLGGSPYLYYGDGAHTAFEGRLEDLAIRGDGLAIGAFGYWRALRDVPYTAVWSTSSVADWRILTSDDHSQMKPERWKLDNNNRLYMAPTKNEIFGTLSRGSWGYMIPDGSERSIVKVSFNYVLDAPSPWRIRLNSRNSTWAIISNPWTLNGTGSVQSGSTSVTFSACAGIDFGSYYNSSDTTYTGETGAVYARITNVRVQTTTSSGLYADEIARALVDFVTAVNPEMLSDKYSLIECPAVDLDDEIYLDSWPAEILTRLAGIGDDQSPPQRWEVGVWEGRRLHLRPKGAAARTWYIDIAKIELERSLDLMINSAYAVYNSGNNRTDIAVNQVVIDTAGVVRRGPVTANTTSESLAETYRDAYLNDGSESRARSEIVARGVFDGRGASWPPWMVRGGDRVVVRNLPPDLNELDGIRSFTLSRTRYHGNDNTLILMPAELPSLEFLIARREK